MAKSPPSKPHLTEENDDGLGEVKVSSKLPPWFQAAIPSSRHYG